MKKDKLVKKPSHIKSPKTIITLLIILAVLISGTFFFYQYPVSCETFQCFQKEMSKCSTSSYINEEPEASWGYNVLGKNKNNCQVEVVLLQAKQGELGIDKLNTYSMICEYPLGSATYPEKDLSRCTGPLKEGLQTIIIEKLHVYILNNLGSINETLYSGTLTS